MTAPTPATDLAALLAERDRVEAWLAALDGRRETTPPAVFEKVQRDYGARLEGLTAQLKERDRELEQRVTALAAALTAVEQEQQAKQEARAEAELRHAVGEYTEAQWATVARESDTELTAIEARRAECARDHQAALALLASVRRPATPAVPAPAAQPRLTPAPSAAIPPARPVASTPPRAATPAAGVPVMPPATPPKPAAAITPHDAGASIKTPASDELAFLSSLAADVARRSGTAKAVTDAAPAAAPAPASAPLASAPSAPAPVAPAPRPSRPVTAAETAAPARPSRPVAAEAAPVVDQRRTTIPAPVPAEPVDTGVPPEHAALTDADVNVPRGSHHFTPPSVPARRQTSPRVNSRDSASILRRAQTDHVKSLKCVECGTLNLPTEWYCEKCGAELSAL
ncbi:MAG: zinc ribbon domain-containing protein [Gemmatimonadetes bacterium]|nr:zinc ribbon domain-containing protein [Gemmatimonadota bacterium]